MGSESGATPCRPGWRGTLLAALAGIGVAAACWLVQPWPFTWSDGIARFLPLIKAHTDATLAGVPLRMAWGLGSGWSPWEAGETGYLYPIYPVANLIARGLGNPLLLLEVAAGLHLALAGAFAWRLLPGSILPRERRLWTLVLLTLPAPLMLGVSWVHYLGGYPWFLALALLGLDPAPWTNRRGIAVIALVGMFYLVSHVQMAVIGVGLLGIWLWSLRGWEARRFLAALACSLLPLLPSLLWILGLARDGNRATMAMRDSAGQLLAGSQGLGTALQGMLAGNLLGAGGFSVYEASATGIGLFFMPAVLLLGGWLLRQRRGWELAFWVAMVALLGLASFPWLRFLPGSALLGFRWTWKLMLYAAPLAWLGVLMNPAWRAWKPPARTAALLVACVLQAVVASRGLGFGVVGLWDEARPAGAGRLFDQTRAALEASGLPKGARLALIGWNADVVPTPAPMLGLLGNAPLLYGYESLSLFEPLEAEAANRSHLGIGNGARPLITEDVLRRPGLESALAACGVDALLTAVPGTLGGPQVSTLPDFQGRETYLARLPRPGPATFPWGLAGVREIPLVRLPDGSLMTRTPLDGHPVLGIPRVLRWERQPDGRWRGEPGGPSMSWFLATAAGLLAALLLAQRVLPEPTGTSSGASAGDPRPWS